MNSENAGRGGVKGLKVAKFGGSSLASADMIIKVCDIITSDTQRRLVVVSAPGKRSKDDIKVTDLLIALGETFLEKGSAEKELHAVVERFADIIAGLGLPSDLDAEVALELRSRLESDTSHAGRFVDRLKAVGEDLCAKLIARYLQSQGHDAEYVNPKDAGLLLSDEYGNAQVLPESYENLKNALSDRSGITIFPGFFGYSPDGHLVTFPRGGSDITGAILAAAVGVDVYENFTDVDSVFAANPNVVDSPVAISEVTLREMRELSYAGFGVFHAEALAPVYRAGIPVNIKNTNNPTAAGTRILPVRDGNHSAVGIASDKGFCSIFVSKYLMNREIGFGRKLLQIIEDEGMCYEHTPSGIDNISVIVSEKELTAEVEKRVLDRVRSELGVDDISVERGLALVMVVGEGMRHSIGIADKACAAFAKANVNIEMINQGSSEVSMMFGVKAVDADQAVKALYREFFEA